MIESFLKYIQYERNYSLRTVFAYGEDLSQFDAFLAEREKSVGSAAVCAEDVRDWMMEMIRPMRSGNIKSENACIAANRTSKAKSHAPFLPIFPNNLTIFVLFSSKKILSKSSFIYKKN